jgi:hypothetical protein
MIMRPLLVARKQAVAFTSNCIFSNQGETLWHLILPKFKEIFVVLYLPSLYGIGCQHSTPDDQRGPGCTFLSYRGGKIGDGPRSPANIMCKQTVRHQSQYLHASSVLGNL